MQVLHSPFYTIQELKGFDFSPWGGIDGFLQASSHGQIDSNRSASLKRMVPDLSKAVDMTPTAVSSLPFALLSKSGDVVDSSKDWKNKAGGHPRRLLYLLASSLCGGVFFRVNAGHKFVFTIPAHILPFTR